MNGVCVVDKPSGFTSHDCVLFLRQHFSIKKLGHAGTLDPMATGVLVMLLGDATKLSNHFITDDKEYEGVLRLGVTTDTYDSDGKVISIKEIPSLTHEGIKDIFGSFCGDIEQTPPLFSAIKHKGSKLYELARRGVKVQPRSREVTIYDIGISKIELPDVYFYVRCSKGTYIRSLASDIGARLGCGACLIGLRRIRSGRFTVEDAVTLEELFGFDKGTLEEHLLRLS